MLLKSLEVSSSDGADELIVKLAWKLSQQLKEGLVQRALLENLYDRVQVQINLRLHKHVDQLVRKLENWGSRSQKQTTFTKQTKFEPNGPL